MAKNACDAIKEGGRIPLFVGGTGLYIDSFFKGLSSIPEIEESVRKKLSEEIKNQGSSMLYNELKKVDPEFALRVHPNDSQRIMRGLQVYRGTGRSLSSFYMERPGAESDETLYIGIAPGKKELYDKIDLRVDMMMSMGFIDEVEKLRYMGYSPQLPSMRSIGYAEINDFLDGFLSYKDAVDKIKVSTKKYAKRQMTWFQRNKKISWFMPEDLKKIRQKIENWLNY
jgi:tRNA dimethylallyltransferase